MTDTHNKVISAMLHYSHSLEWVTYPEIRKHVPASIKKQEILEALQELVQAGYLKSNGRNWWGFDHKRLSQ